MINLQGKIALVTGASRGIGSAILLTLSRAGAYVIGTATTQEGANTINSVLEKEGLLGKGAVLDVTNGPSVDELLDK